MYIDKKQFEFIAELETNWTAIRDEYLALPTTSFDPWVQREMYGEGWTVFGLYAFGKKVPGACLQCPKTTALIENVPGMTTAGFSKLSPGTHIKPHVGWAASVYRMHLGLVVPDGCRMRVGNETRNWREGDGVVFDDTVEHEAWNDSQNARAVLLLDFLRPGIDPDTVDPMPEEVRKYTNDFLKHSY